MKKTQTENTFKAYYDKRRFLAQFSLIDNEFDEKEQRAFEEELKRIREKRARFFE